MLQARLWFARVVALYAVLIFSYLGWLYAVEPLDHISGFGISAEGTPESANFIRVSVAALFIGQAIIAVWGLARPANLINSLKILVLFLGCTVAMRIFGITVEGVSDLQITELRDEGISWLFFVVALIGCPRPGEQ